MIGLAAGSSAGTTPLEYPVRNRRHRARISFAASRPVCRSRRLLRGILLLGCWKMWRELQRTRPHESSRGQLAAGTHAVERSRSTAPPKNAAQAAGVVLADVRCRSTTCWQPGRRARAPYLLVLGLLLSGAMMGVAEFRSRCWRTTEDHLVGPRLSSTWRRHDLSRDRELLPWPLRRGL